MADDLENLPRYIRPYSEMETADIIESIREDRGRNTNCLCYGEDFEHEGMTPGCLYAVAAERLRGN